MSTATDHRTELADDLAAVLAATPADVAHGYRAAVLAEHRAPALTLPARLAAAAAVLAEHVEPAPGLASIMAGRLRPRPPMPVALADRRAGIDVETIDAGSSVRRSLPAVPAGPPPCPCELPREHPRGLDACHVHGTHVIPPAITVPV